jgi:3-methyladenine DNA glycosylase/8-oxoguanine DNA glycosylase
MQRRLIESFGDALTYGGNIYFAIPRSEWLAAATIEVRRACSLFGRKAEYVQGVGKMVTEEPNLGPCGRL